jgi:thioredoxin-like negative regulator of GroEL
LELQWNAQAVDLFAEAVNAYPMHRELRLGYALALARVGAREQARGQLEDVVRASDADRTGAAARRMLQVMRE